MLLMGPSLLTVSCHDQIALYHRSVLEEDLTLCIVKLDNLFVQLYRNTKLYCPDTQSFVKMRAMGDIVGYFKIRFEGVTQISVAYDIAVLPPSDVDSFWCDRPFLEMFEDSPSV